MIAEPIDYVYVGLGALALIAVLYMTYTKFRDVGKI